MANDQGGASLMHVDMSQGKPVSDRRKEEEQFSFPSSITAEISNLVAQKFVIFKLVKKKKGRTWIDGICDNVLNPKTKRRERIILLNGADSIWQSELVELLKDKEYYKRNRRSILFENSIARIPVEDERAIEFLRLTKNNVGKTRSGSGKYDFFEYDALEEQKARAEKQNFKLKTVLTVNDMSADSIKKLASFLGIVFYDDLGMPKGDDGIKTELLMKADTVPDLVAKYIDSREVEVAWMVRKAIVEAKIDLLGQSGNAIWAGGKGFIGKIPAGRKAYEYLTELAMTNSDEGRNFLEQLKTIVT